MEHWRRDCEEAKKSSGGGEKRGKWGGEGLINGERGRGTETERTGEDMNTTVSHMGLSGRVLPGQRRRSACALLAV